MCLPILAMWQPNLARCLIHNICTCCTMVIFRMKHVEAAICLVRHDLKVFEVRKENGGLLPYNIIQSCQCQTSVSVSKVVFPSACPLPPPPTSIICMPKASNPIIEHWSRLPCPTFPIKLQIWHNHANFGNYWMYLLPNLAASYLTMSCCSQLICIITTYMVPHIRTSIGTHDIQILLKISVPI